MKKLTKERKINTLNQSTPKKVEPKTKPHTKLSIPRTPKDGGFVVHEIKYEFIGSSKPYGVHKGSTPLRLERFGKLPKAILSERDSNLLKNIRAVYRTKPFVRGDYDAGTLSRLGERGYLKLVNGQANSVNAVLQLTDIAF